MGGWGSEANRRTAGGAPSVFRGSRARKKSKSESGPDGPHNTATHNTPTTTQQHTNTPTHQQLSISQSNIRRRPKLISQHRSQPVACRSYFCFLALELRWIDCSLVVVGFCLVCTFVTFVLSSHRRLPALPVVACNLCCVAVCEEFGVGWLCRGDLPIHG